MRRTWTLVVLGLVFGACGSDESKGTQDSSTQDTEVFVPDLVPVDLIEPDTTPDGVDIVEVVEPPKPGEFGYECDEGLDCNIGWCIQTADARICTRECFDSCPNGFECRLAPGTDALRICLPKFNNLCDPCRETTDCNDPGTVGNYCLSYGANGRFCGAACSADPDCPGGYVCRNVPVGGGAEAKQCVPADGEECKCSPLAKQLQKATTCFLENDNGKCEGTRFCLQSGLSMCDAATPFPESCNSKDDNCDGVTDEFPPNYVCEIVNDIGTCPGVGICNEGVETCSGTPAKLDNNCDGIDDDCDGDTDEEACNDGNECTDDLCSTNASGQVICTHANNNQRLCDDGNGCTVVDRCFEGACVGSEARSCDDGNPCTEDRCDPITGECVFTPAAANTPCDRDACTVGEFCDGFGACVGGTPKIYVPKSQGGCIEEGGTYHADCQSYECVGAGVCVPQHHTRRDYDCRIGTGTCSTGKCGTDGRCGSTVAPNTSCVYSGTVPQCQRAICAGFECRPEANTAANGSQCTYAGDLGACEQATCSNGACLKAPRTGSCTFSAEDSSNPLIRAFSFCLPPVDGTCGSAGGNGGECVPNRSFAGCSCSGCSNGICVCCPAFAILGSYCLQ
ncbi:MAG TPA: hypothetical protein PK095_10105 [Myxococcota bacterium]|nr:hypothetical protein [Myxococcota bacterium]